MPGETHPPGPRSDLAGEASSLAALVRHHDRDRYQTALLAPARRRGALLALYAFNYEIARVRETVTQPMLGQIRLQWWREVLDTAYAGAPARQHPVAVPLSAVIREFGLSREPFDRLIDTRERDLADEPPASLAALEDYAEGSSAALVYLALQALGGREATIEETALQARDRRSPRCCRQSSPAGSSPGCSAPATTRSCPPSPCQIRCKSGGSPPPRCSTDFSSVGSRRVESFDVDLFGSLPHRVAVVPGLHA